MGTRNFKPAALPVPVESVEQQCLFRWAFMEEAAHPELKWLYHVPNGGKRNKREAARLRDEGVKPGVPDLCLPVPRGDYHGLYIEMKRIRGGTTSDDQKDWLAELQRQGYYACVCRGWEEAAHTIIAYLEL
jgi:hypothetical protein